MERENSTDSSGRLRREEKATVLGGRMAPDVAPPAVGATGATWVVHIRHVMAGRSDRSAEVKRRVAGGGLSGRCDKAVAVLRPGFKEFRLAS